MVASGDSLPNFVWHIAHGICVYEFWTNRDALLAKLALLPNYVWECCQTRKQAGSINEPLRVRLEELRLREIRKLFQVMRVGLFVLFCVCIALGYANLLRPPFLIVVMIAHFLCKIEVSMGWRIDAMFILLSCFRIFITILDVTGFTGFHQIARDLGTQEHISVVFWANRLRLRTLGRLIHSLFTLNWWCTAPVNTIDTLLAISASCLTEGWTNAVKCTIVMELFFLCATTVTCILTETWLKDLLQQELVLDSERRATENLLSGFCDAVVHLTSDLRIAKATPQLLHVLCPTDPSDLANLEGTKLSTHLASDQDIEDFEGFIARTSQIWSDADKVGSGASAALRVNFHHARGRVTPVELFHVCSGDPNQNQRPKHLVGIREVRIEGIAPDESLYEGRKTSLESFEVSAELKSVRVRALVEEHSSENGRHHSTLQPSVREGEQVLNISRGSSKSSQSCDKSQPRKAGVTIRNLQTLTRSRFTCDMLNSDMHIREYAQYCHHDDGEGQQGPQPHHAAPSLRQCLQSKSFAQTNFLAWLEGSINELFHDSDKTYLDYTEPLVFRPPSDACVSSKVILCAKTARINLLDIEDETFLVLDLFDVSQVIPHRQVISRFDAQSLTSVSEAGDDV